MYPAPHDDAGNVEDLLTQLKSPLQPSSREISEDSAVTSSVVGALAGRSLKEPPSSIDVADGNESLPNGGVWRHQTGLPALASFSSAPSPALSKSTRFINRDGMLLSREDESITAASWWLPALWRILSVSTLPRASTPWTSHTCRGIPGLVKAAAQHCSCPGCLFKMRDAGSATLLCAWTVCA